MVLGDPVFSLSCTESSAQDVVTAVGLSAAVGSTRTYINSSGLLAIVAINTPRTEYSGGKWWLKSEGMGVNLCSYSNDLTQGSWAKVTMTAAKNQTGPDGVVNSASLITATGANATILFTTSNPSTSHTASFYLKRVTGTGAVSVTVDNGSTWTAKTITSSWVRYEVTQTTANPVIGIKLATSGDEVAVCGAQVEATAYSTSLIPTSGSIGIRASEEGGISGTDLWTGTATIANGAMFSYAAGNSFAYMPSHRLANYVKTGNRYKITVTDSTGGTGHNMVGYVGAQDSAFAVGSEMWDAAASVFTSGTYGWVVYGTNTIANVSNSLEITYVDHASGAYVFFSDSTDFSSDLTIGQLYRLMADTKVSAGASVNVDTTWLGTGVWTETSTSFVTHTTYGVATSAISNRVYLSSFGAGEKLYFDNMSLKPVNSASTDGVRVMNAVTGGSQGWITTDAGSFNYNSATYTVLIEFVEINGYSMPNASLWGGDGWTSGSYNMDTAGSMVLNWYPLIARSLYTTQAIGIVSINSVVTGLLYNAPTATYNNKLTTRDGVTANIHQTVWSTARNYKVASTWSGSVKNLYLDTVTSTGATAYDGGWNPSDSLGFFLFNKMPTMIEGLKLYNFAAAADATQEFGVDLTGAFDFGREDPAGTFIFGEKVGGNFIFGE